MLCFKTTRFEKSRMGFIIVPSFDTAENVTTYSGSIKLLTVFKVWLGKKDRALKIKNNTQLIKDIPSMELIRSFFITFY